MSSSFSPMKNNKPLQRFVATKTQSTKKRKYPEDQTEISTELTLSCYCPRKIMKPATATTDHIQPTKILSSCGDCNNLSSSTTLNLSDKSSIVRITHNPKKISQCCDEKSGVSTELTLSCYCPRKIMKPATTTTDRIQPTKILSSFGDCNNLSSSTTLNLFDKSSIVRIPHNPEKISQCSDEESGVSTELTLSCYCPRKIMKPATTTADHIQPTKILSSFGDCNNLSSSTTLNLSDKSSIVRIPHNPEKISQCSDEESGVSTELTLSCYPGKIEKPTTSIISSATKNFSSSSIKITDNPEKMSPNSGEERGVSTELTLSFEYKSIKNSSTHNANPWKITKKLTESDVGHMSRLLVSSVEAAKHALPFFSEEIVEKIESDGAKVAIWDCDTNTQHQLVFKRWGSSRSFVFIDRWIPDFVNRRKLKKGHEVGLYWDSSQSRFNFSVLHR